MRYWTYILISETTGRHYCGSTDDIQRRVQQHNDPNHTSTKTTKRFPGPWKLLWTQEHETRSEAMDLEKRIKKRGIARFLVEQNG
ncbi:MAG TPA: GIY-YIG nuclease family protein [Candidatus Hydrogenedentes bacterium]|nr:GIY-YIG nuclease family protein [Candidatus Hydrogenedentota bacterium]